MLLVKAWVGPSAIHGLGLIAHQHVQAGTVMWRLVPGFDVLLTEAELKQLAPMAQLHIAYYGYYDARLGKYILCSDDDRFTNHSENANSRFFGDYATAARDILPGEEITDNYNDYGRPVHIERGLAAALLE